MKNTQHIKKYLMKKRIQKLKNEYETSYIGKIANKRYEVFNSFYNRKTEKIIIIIK